MHLNNKPTNQNDKKVQPSIGGSESFLLFTFRGKNLAENLGQDGRNLNTSIIQVLGARYGDKFFRNWGTVCFVRGGWIVVSSSLFSLCHALSFCTRKKF